MWQIFVITFFWVNNINSFPFVIFPLTLEFLKKQFWLWLVKSGFFTSLVKYRNTLICNKLWSHSTCSMLYSPLYFYCPIVKIHPKKSVGTVLIISSRYKYRQSKFLWPSFLPMIYFINKANTHMSERQKQTSLGHTQ